MGTHPIFESDFDCLTEMSATLLNEINEKLAKMPYLGGYSPSDEDKAILSQLRDPPIQHINALRWYNQMNHELGLNKTVKKNDESCDGKACPGEVVNNVPDGFSTKVNPDILPALKSQRDPKTGQLKEDPVFIKHRMDLFDDLFAKQEERYANMEKTPIKITLPDGAVKDGKAYETTPLDVAKDISQGLANAVVAAKVDGKVWDLTRRLEGDCNLALLKFDDKDGLDTYWHSSAHILGECMERYFGGALCYGPPIEDGFYYDMWMGERTVSEKEDIPKLEKLYAQMIKEKQPFQRLEVTGEQLREMFKHNPFKQRLIQERNIGDTTVYRCGNLIDMCRGPHLPHTGKAKAIKLYKTSATYWEGNAEQESLQRIYGITFPDKKRLQEWIHIQEEAKKRDHRKIGVEQELWMFNQMSPGSCFWLPRGAIIYNRLQDFLRKEYRRRGFKEVVTPNIFNSELWKTSGHWDHYSDDIFKFDVDKDVWALKPMNCPSHCVMFGNRARSYKDLPLRFADFGVLHRNELSGALSGLTRVRRFQQDDAHIFCLPEQLTHEVYKALRFFKHVYDIFGFTFELRLSTRPEKFLGDIAVWDKAEADLSASLDGAGLPWKLNPGDGAFYGPKIDITLQDALRRSHQCATIQLDFQLPLRFNLGFTDEKGEKKHPVIIHRAILGSVERMVAVLTENFGGKWPFWLSPRQAMVVPVAPLYNDYAREIVNLMKTGGFCVEADVDNGNTMNKKVRNAQLAQFNFIFVVGEKEQSNRTVNVRTRDNKVHGEFTLEAVSAKFTELATERIIKSE